MLDINKSYSSQKTDKMNPGNSKSAFLLHVYFIKKKPVLALSFF